MTRTDDPSVTRDVALTVVWDIGALPALP